ncbi:MAG: aquaporin [Acidobacteriota bacterium]
MKSYLVEFIGTFFLVLVIGLVVIDPGAGNLAPVAIGSILTVLVYAGGPISGAHYNPAVTLAVWLRGKCDRKDVPPYIMVQCIGAILAGFAVRLLKAGSPVNPMNPVVGHALLAEVLFTFALAFVILNVATSKKSSGNSYFGLAIGFTVLAGAYAVGPISGAVFNPAVALGITTMGLSAIPNLWIYLVADFIGGAAATTVYKLANPDEF